MYEDILKSTGRKDICIYETAKDWAYKDLERNSSIADIKDVKK